MSNSIIGILFPTTGLVKKETLEALSQITTLELQRLVSEDGVFIKPGVLTKTLNGDTLLPSTTSSGIQISVGSAVTSSGKFINVVETLSKSVNLASHVGYTLFIKYVTETSDDLQTRSPSSGMTHNIATIKSQNVDDILFWVNGYDPTLDPDLETYPDSVPLGKLQYIIGSYAFNVGDGHRRIALLNIPYIASGHWDGEFSKSVEEYTSSIYNFLACEGHGTKITENPFGLTATDIEHVLGSFKALVYQKGIPTEDFTTAPNKDYMLVEDNTAAKGASVKVNAGTAIDGEGRRLYLSNAQSVSVTDDNTWYYLAIKYLESTNIKDYYEFLQTTGDQALYDSRVNLARVKNNGGTISIIDERQLLLCRGYYPEPDAPSVPDGLILTTGYEDDDLHSTDIDATYGEGATGTMRERRSIASAVKAYITADWDPSTGDPIAYDVIFTPLDSSNNPIVKRRTTRRSLVVTGTTPDDDHTLHNLTPGIKWQVQVRAVGRSPHHIKSDYCTAENIISGIGASLLMGSITLSEKYFGGNVSTGQVQSQSTTRYQAQGIEITWDQVLGAYAYEVYGQKDISPSVKTPASRRIAEFLWRGNNLKCFVPAIDGEHWYFSVRCYDSGGFPSSNTSTGDIVFGDDTPPSIPTSLQLETGFMEELIPPAQRVLQTRKSVHPELVYIRAQWLASTDNKTGVARYDVWYAPDKKTNPGVPDENLMDIRVSYAQSVAPPVYYTIPNLRPGIKYWIKVRAIDGRGNISDWCAHSSIVAGGETLPVPVKPVVTLTPATNAIEITWDRDSKAHGYEVFARENADPGVDPSEEYLIGSAYKGTRVVYNTPSSGVVKAYVVYVRVRGINKAGFYGEISDVKFASPSIIDAPTFLALKSEVELARGDAVSIDKRMSISLDSAGRMKPITELDSEIADARSGYQTLGALLRALQSGSIAWQYVRIVAKNGTGNYETVQAAVNSVTSSDPTLILIMPDGGEGYDESVDVGNKVLGFVGLGSPKEVMIGPNLGRIYSSGSECNVFLAQNFLIRCSDQNYNEILWLKPTPSIMSSCYVDNVWIKQTGANFQRSVLCEQALGDSVNFYTNNLLINMETGVGVQIQNASNTNAPKLFGNNLQIDSKDVCVRLAQSSLYKVYVWIWNSVLKTDATYSIAGTITTSYTKCLLYAAHLRYNKIVNELTGAGEAGVTAEYGAVNNISNVLFASGLEICEI